MGREASSSRTTTQRCERRLLSTPPAVSTGILKSDYNAKAATVSAGAVRIDDVLRGRDVCLLKADVEGYEPQVMQTAQTLLATREVPNLQLEHV